MGATRADRRWRHREQMPGSVCSPRVTPPSRCVPSAPDPSLRDEQAQLHGEERRSRVCLHAVLHSRWSSSAREGRTRSPAVAAASVNSDGAPAPPPGHQRLGAATRPQAIRAAAGGRRHARTADGHVFRPDRAVQRSCWQANDTLRPREVLGQNLQPVRRARAESLRAVQVRGRGPSRSAAPMQPARRAAVRRSWGDRGRCSIAATVSGEVESGGEFFGEVADGGPSSTVSGFATGA